jgi:DNA-binding transcriptional LysR family regulator
MVRSSLRGIDMNLLLVLEAVVDEENVGRAARRVGLSASAMSHALARLRRVIDDPILVRSGRRMTTTARARALAEPLRQGLSLVASALDRPRELDPRTERRTLRIATSDFGLNLLIPALVRRLAREAPLVDVVVTPMGPHVHKELVAGEVDLGIAANRPVKGYRSKVVLEEAFVCVVRRGHPALAGRMTARRFAELGHIIISPRGRTPGAVDQALRKKGLRRRVTLVAPTFLGAATVVRSSDLVLTCGERSARTAAPWLDLVSFAPPVQVPPFQLVLHWHERQEHEPFLRWVRATLEAEAAAAGG